MPNPSKRKGDRAELEVAALLADLLGVDVRRKLGAGRADDTGDLDAPPGSVLDQWVLEVKNYADLSAAIRDGLDDAERERANARRPFCAALVRRRGGRWIAVLDLTMFAGVLRELAPEPPDSPLFRPESDENARAYVRTPGNPEIEHRA